MHPSIFANCDGDGYIEVWDINRDTEAPVVHKQTPKRSALNCLRWNPDGRRIAVGDSEGYVTLWSLDKEVAQPKSEDFMRFDELIQNQLMSMNANIRV